MDSGIPGGGFHVSIRTTCGRQIQVGHLALGGAHHPAQRVSLDISDPSGADGGTWAGLTAGEARRLAAALLLQATACETGIPNELGACRPAGSRGSGRGAAGD